MLLDLTIERGVSNRTRALTTPSPPRAAGVRIQSCRLQCEVSLANIVVGLQFIDGRGIDDLALVDDGGVAGKAKAEMHVLLRDQNRRPGAAQLPQKRILLFGTL